MSEPKRLSDEALDRIVRAARLEGETAPGWYGEVDRHEVIFLVEEIRRTRAILRELVGHENGPGCGDGFARCHWCGAHLTKWFEYVPQQGKDVQRDPEPHAPDCIWPRLEAEVKG